jgi:hypothetical protein
MKFIFCVFSTIFLLVAPALINAESDWDTANESYQGDKEIKVYRDPDCQCCHKWIQHLEKHQFTVIDMLTRDMASVKEAVKLPKQMTSCHTALIDNYIIEGHVPADEIKRLLNTKPNIAGLSVPQMPIGTPGMEVGNRKDDFIVFSFDKSGAIDVFNKYQQTPSFDPRVSETTHNTKMD